MKHNDDNIFQASITHKITIYPLGNIENFDAKFKITHYMWYYDNNWVHIRFQSYPLSVKIPDNSYQNFLKILVSLN